MNTDMKRLIPAVLLMFSATMGSFATTIFTIEDLGSTGGSRMTATAINSAGEVIGHGTNPAGDWTPFSTFAAVPLPNGADGAMLYAINGNAHLVGNVHVQGSSQATLWVNGTAQVLGGLGGSDSYATGINAHGQISGMATTAAGAGHAVIYTSSSIHDVALPGSHWSSANAINTHGAIAGSAMNGNLVYQAYTWSEANGYTTLGTLGGLNSYAKAINDQGVVAGHSQDASGYLHAFVWDGTSMIDLGTLGGTSSFAYGINTSNQVVGYSFASDGSTRAFLHMGGVLLDLNSMVANLGNWVLTEAYAINDAGQITGTGVLDGVERAFRLTPLGVSLAAQVAVPEPGTIWLGSVAFVVIAGMAARRRRA
jgi:probable HAF family extracellular repeat protein